MWEEWMMEDLRKQEEVVFPPPLFPYTTHKYLGAVQCSLPASKCDKRPILITHFSVTLPLTEFFVR